MFDLAAVLIALSLLMYLAFRGFTLILLAPATALLACALTGGLPILGAYTQVFMSNVGQFVISFFPLFLLGAIFGKLIDDTGSARSIARAVSAWLRPKRAIASVVLCCSMLTYGGGAFVVAFAIYPVAAALFRDADIPKRLIPGALALGAFSFTMSALPGTPAIQNAIPMLFFGTTAFAAPGLGLLAAVIMLSFGLAWLERRAAGARAARRLQGARGQPAGIRPRHAGTRPQRKLRHRRAGPRSAGASLGEFGSQPAAVLAGAAAGTGRHRLELRRRRVRPADDGHLVPCGAVVRRDDDRERAWHLGGHQRSVPRHPAADRR